MNWWENTDLEFIKQTIEEQKININNVGEYKLNDGVNFLMLACRDNTNLEIIKYLAENHFFNVHDTDANRRNCLIMACWKNTNLDIIKYLIETQKINTTCVDNSGDNCLSFACWKNTNLRLIKYLIEERKMNIHHTNRDNHNCLSLACMGNANPEIVEYLTENCKMALDHVNRYGNNCWTVAFGYNHNTQIMKYLLNTYNLYVLQHLQLNRICFDRFKLMLNIASDHCVLFNELLIKGIDHYKCGFKIIISAITNYNPLILSKKVIDRFKIPDPYKYDFNTFMNYVNKLTIPIEYPANLCPFKTLEKKECIDFANMELLFEHNGKQFFGNRNIVYKSIQLLNDLVDLCSMNECVVLSGKLPDHIINHYIESCYYDNSFDVNIINEDDFMEFIMFIDKYPTTSLSIDTLETQLVDYAIKHRINCDSLMTNICTRYKLKKMVIYMHNQKYLHNE